MRLQSADDFRRGQSARVAVAAGHAVREWAGMGDDFDQSWSRIGPRIVVVTHAAQLGSSRAALTYVPAVLAETRQPDRPVAAVDPQALAGYSSDGRSLTGLLLGAVTTTKSAVALGRSVEDALAVGSRWLEMAVRTQVADAGRTAAGVAIAVRPDVKGYVRVAEGACCDRCAVLVGETYEWSDGFERHPGCECINVPVTDATEDELRTDPQDLVDDGLVHGLSDADQSALDDGADLAQVVNAHRGLESLSVAGRLVQTTTEGTTKRGVAGKLLGNSTHGIRLTPEQIYADSRDRTDAVRLLARFGYVK